MAQQLVILGASGDLTSRYLVPALARIHAAGRLPDELAIVGVARDGWDDATFRRHLGERLDRHAADVPAETRDALLNAISYHQADVSDAAALRAVLPRDDRPVTAYLALPPSVFGPAITALDALQLPEGSRVVVEKPFGEDLESAQELNRLLHATFPEEEIFRVDHFLAMQTVQNILGLRFANRLLEPVWNREHISRVEIIWDETLTLEGRAGYYDRAGALRDMIQNHLLQLLCLVAMEPPLSLGARDLRDRKIDVLRAVHRLSPAEVAARTVRARYAAGRIGDREVIAYREEEGIDPARGTETFAAVTLTLDNWRWAGVPFHLRTGKALGRDRFEILIHFQPVPHLAFGRESAPACNVLCLSLEPDGMTLTLNTNRSDDPFDLAPVTLAAPFPPQDLPAYGRLLLDVLRGDPTLSIRDDEAEEAWRIMAPILAGWGTDRVPLLEYPAGSDGPDLANW